MDFLPELFVAAAFAGVSLIFGSLWIKLIPSRRAAIVERLGRYNRTLLPGINFIVPFIESVPNINWTYRNQQDQLVHKSSAMVATCVQQMDIPPVKCISKETTPIDVDISVMYQITNLRDAVYNSNDSMNMFYQAVHQSVRDVCSRFMVEDLQGRDSEIGKEMVAYTLSLFGKENGITCCSIVVQSITLGVDVIAARKRRFEAEQARKVRLDEITFQEEMQRRQNTIALIAARNAAECQVVKTLTPFLDSGFTPDQIVAHQRAVSIANHKNVTLFSGAAMLNSTFHSLQNGLNPQ